jgi:hypothetical protein
MSFGAYYTVARRLGFAIRPAEHGLFTTEIVLSGAIDGQAVRARRTIGKAATLVVVAELHPPLDLGLQVVARSVLETMKEWLGAEDVEVGLAGFDEPFAVRADEAERARALFGHEPLREALAAHASSLMTVTDAAVQLDLDVTFGNSDARLERFIQLAAILARQFDGARRAPEPARALVPSLEAWRAFAAERGLETCFGAPIWMHGELGGVEATVATRRKARDVHEIEVSVRLEQPLDFALDIVPARSGIAGWFAGQDVEIGDPAFDAAFLVKTDAVERARAVLDPELRAAILAMAQGRAFVLGAHALAVRDDAARFAPDDVPALVESLADAARRLSRNARLPPPQGYR